MITSDRAQFPVNSAAPTHLSKLKPGLPESRFPCLTATGKTVTQLPGDLTENGGQQTRKLVNPLGAR